MQEEEKQCEDELEAQTQSDSEETLEENVESPSEVYNLLKND